MIYDIVQCSWCNLCVCSALTNVCEMWAMTERVTCQRQSTLTHQRNKQGERGGGVKVRVKKRTEPGIIGKRMVSQPRLYREGNAYDQSLQHRPARYSRAPWTLLFSTCALNGTRPVLSLPLSFFMLSCIHKVWLNDWDWDRQIEFTALVAVCTLRAMGRCVCAHVWLKHSLDGHNSCSFARLLVARSVCSLPFLSFPFCFLLTFLLSCRLYGCKST